MKAGRMVFVAGLAAILANAEAVDVDHLVSGNIGSVGSDIYYEVNTPVGDECVWAWDLISKPNIPITGTWGNKTGLFVPAPYGNYGLGRSASQPTTYIQIYGHQLGICLDVQPNEVSSQTYNPNVKFLYKWKSALYPGNQGTATWLYPYHTAYPSTDPKLQCSFDAAIKFSTGTGVRHANTSFLWIDESTGSSLYVQQYVYDSRTSISPVMSGYDPKIKQLWVAQALGSLGTYCTPLSGSAVFANAVWPDYKYFGISQSWTQFCSMITYLNNKHGINMGFNRNKWRLVSVSFNLEMQRGYSGCLAGKVKDVEVWTRY